MKPVNQRLNSTDLIDVLADLFTLCGVPGYIRSDNGAEFTAAAVQDWIAAVGSKTAYIEPGSPCGRKDIVKASTRSSATSCSMAKSSAPWRKQGSSAKVGGGIITNSGLIHRWATSRRRLRLSSHRARLRNFNQLRRALDRWHGCRF